MLLNSCTSTLWAETIPTCFSGCVKPSFRMIVAVARMVYASIHFHKKGWMLEISALVYTPAEILLSATSMGMRQRIYIYIYRYIDIDMFTIYLFTIYFYLLFWRGWAWRIPSSFGVPGRARPWLMAILGPGREFLLGSWDLYFINGNFRILKWRYLPYIRPI